MDSIGGSRREQTKGREEITKQKKDHVHVCETQKISIPLAKNSHSHKMNKGNRKKLNRGRASTRFQEREG